MGAALIIVSYQTLGLKTLQHEYFEDGECYMDDDKTFYQAFGSKTSTMENVSDPEVQEAGGKAFKILKARDPKYEMNLAGEGLLHGGSLVVDKTGKVVYSFSEDFLGDTVDPQELLKAAQSAQ